MHSNFSKKPNLIPRLCVQASESDVISLTLGGRQFPVRGCTHACVMLFATEELLSKHRHIDEVEASLPTERIRSPCSFMTKTGSGGNCTTSRPWQCLIRTLNLASEFGRWPCPSLSQLSSHCDRPLVSELFQQLISSSLCRSRLCGERSSQ